MSTWVKWATAAITAVLWVMWFAARSAAEVVPDIGPGHRIVTSALAMATIVASIALVLMLLIAPAGASIVKTAEVWHQLGIEEQKRSCDGCPHHRRRSNIIPVHFNGSITRLPEPVPRRDN